MIRYALGCAAGHEFESWFRSSDDYEGQEARGLVACPFCGSTKVQRQIMAPQIARKDREAIEREAAHREAGAADAGAAGAGQPVALIDPEARALRQKVAELRAEMMANAEDVGNGFAEEARKIHFGETPQRAIHGSATREEARALAEDGVSFLPLPMAPQDRN